MTLRKMSSWLDTRRTFVFIVAIGMFAMAARSVTDPDVWWHLRTGQLIVKNHAVFHVDPFSNTKFGQPWINHEWLSDVLIFEIYRIANWCGLITVFAAISSATFMVIFLRCAGRYSAAAFAVWAAFMAAPAYGVRPQNLSLLLASVFLLILECSYTRANVLWFTVPLMVLWVNLHAGYALGIAFIGLFLAGNMADRIFGQKTASAHHSRNLALAMAGCLAIIPLNPYGARMYVYPFHTIHSQFVLAYVSEWFSPNFHQEMYLPFLLMVLSLIGTTAVSRYRLRPRELLLLGVTLLSALYSARSVPVFALVAAPMLSKLFQGWLPERQVTTSTPFAGSALFNGIVLSTFLLLGGLKIRHLVLTLSLAEAKSYPEDAVSFLTANHLPPRLFNSYNWGGYLIWRTYPSYPVYIDGRTDLYGDASMAEFGGIYQVTDPSWQDKLERSGVRTAILPTDAPLASALRLRSDWKQVYEDALAVVLVKAR